jgi:hypothetical protein
VEHPQSSTLKAVMQNAIVIQHVVKCIDDGGDESKLPIEAKVNLVIFFN